MTRYLRIRVESGVPWPTKETTVPFRDHELTLCPETDQLAPTVLLAYDDSKMIPDEAVRFVRHFLSSLSWAESRPIQDLEYLDGTQPFWIGKGGGRVLNPNFRADYLPDPSDPKARRALALYREALYVNSIPYKVLGFFKILNVRFPDGPSQMAWINQVIDQLEDVAINERVAALRSEGKNVGEYLYASGRCAVAHAWDEPIADPDAPEDMRRLIWDLPLIHGLAEHVIEHEMGVKSHATIWEEHLYELEGFRLLLGGAFVDRLKRGEKVALEAGPPLPRLSLRVRGKSPWLPLRACTPRWWTAWKGAWCCGVDRTMDSFRRSCD